jgi:hypothetical protein
MKTAFVMLLVAGLVHPVNETPQISNDEMAMRIAAVAMKIRPILGSENPTVVMSALSLLSGEALGSVALPPAVPRQAAMQLFCQETAKIAIKVESERSNQAR